MAESYDHLFKIILAGDAFVGKTNLVHRFVKTYQDIKNISPTIGVEFGTRIVTLSDQKRIKTQIWDTAGQQQYRSITTAHYRNALGALVVYDITKQKTYSHVRRWIEAIRQQASPNVVITLVANKIDLRDRQQVNSMQARKFAKNEGIFFEETSAFTNENVQSTFIKMIEQINKRKKQKDIVDTPQTGGRFIGSRHQDNKNQKCEC